MLLNADHGIRSTPRAGAGAGAHRALVRNGQSDWLIASEHQWKTTATAREKNEPSNPHSTISLPDKTPSCSWGKNRNNSRATTCRGEHIGSFGDTAAARRRGRSRRCTLRREAT
ncbi:hypothetical protein V6N11_062277 [Hibiscus sabdariffa]|uniref:Uncharacterized protein n=1 Tax=Hibiscus sabdariffa TaxID=183260 RepID=A0ABR2PS77_9ROSI